MSENKKIAVVTGTSSGIGFSIANKLILEGWTVYGLDQTKNNVSNQAFVPVQVDLNNVNELNKAFDKILQTAVPKAVIHAAGLLRIGSLGDLDLQNGELMWRTHVEVATKLANRFLPLMISQGHGRMVLIGSRISMGIAHKSQYAATKAALVSLARSWAAESIRGGVTVNVISPAATDTPMLSDPSRISRAPQTPPIGRLIQPAEVAALTVYLVGESAGAITGQDIAICGGSSVSH